MNERAWRALAMLVAVSLVTSAALAGVGLAQERDEDPSPADEIYVEDDGDAVLVYADESDAERAEFGLHVGEGLVYGLVENPVEETPEVRGEFAATAEPDTFEAEGSLSAPRPDVLADLSVEFSGESTAETSRTDLVLSATLVDESGMSALVPEARTSGEVTMTASRFTLDGEFSAETVMPVGEDARLAATLTENEDTYALSVEQAERIDEDAADRWRNRTVAERALREAFAEPVAETNGTVDVTVEALSLSAAGDGRYDLDVAYTVTYRDVDDVLETLVRDALAENPDVSEADAERLAREAGAVTVNDASIAYEVANGDPAGSVALDVSDYESFVLAYLDVAETAQPGTNVEQARAQFEARSAADLRQRFSWSGEFLNNQEDETATFDLEFRGRADNWEAYVEELEARDLPRYDSEFEITGSTDGDRVAFDGSFALGGEALFEQVLDRVHNVSEADPETARTIDALRDAGPRIAKLETSYDAGGFRVEAGAAFEDLGSLRDALVAEHDLPSVSEAVVRPEDGRSVTYVHVDRAVEPGASAADVRGLSAVDDDTTVHMPGEWDREFPSVDTQRARAFLEGGAGGIVPGFGAVAALAALLAVGLLGLRRRR